MGRYDKLRVYDGTNWVQPTRVRYYQNSAWQDLGLNDSDNTRSIYMYTDATHKSRVTLNKHTTTIIEDNCVAGDGFNLLPVNGYCFCPKYSSSADYTFTFECTIRKVSSGDKNIFWTGNGNNNWFEIVWQNDGRIRVSNRTTYGTGNVETLISSNAVGENTWVHLKVQQYANSTSMAIVFNGVTTTGNKYQTFVVSNATNKVGQTGIQFKDNLLVQGSQWQYYSNTANLDMNTIEGNGGQYQNVTRGGTPTTVVTWV